VIVNRGLWDMVFGSGGTGDPNTLYFTAGIARQTGGLFATLIPAAAAGGPDFSLNLSAQTVSVSAGGMSTLNIRSAAVGGFNGQIGLSCAPSAGLTCNFMPATISPGSTTPSSILTITAAASAPSGGYGGRPAMLLLSGFGLFGTLLTTGRRHIASKGKGVFLAALFALVVVGMTFTVACGNYSNHQLTGNQATVMVTGTSGAVSHTVPITVTVQ